MTHQMVRITADIDRPDRVIANLTARQVAILAVTGLLLYAGWGATRDVLPLAAYAVVAIPTGATATILALGHRDGLSLDRLVVAAIRQRLQPRVRITAPEGVRPAPAWLTAAITPSRGESRRGWVARTGAGHRVAQGTDLGTGAYTGGDISPSPLRLPTRAVTDTGVLDLGADGVAVVAACSTVNFALRTAGEQQALVASFGRYLHSLTAPVQILVRAQRVDLSGQIAELRAAAGGLPHPALEAAALEHADYLTQLAGQTELLRRQVLLVLREPVTAAGPADGLGGPSPAAVLAGLASRAARYRARQDQTRVAGAARRAAEARLARRVGEAIDLLAPAGITVTPLDASRATAVLAAACNPDSSIPPSAGLAGADDIITSIPTVITTRPEPNCDGASTEDFTGLYAAPTPTAGWSGYATGESDPDTHAEQDAYADDDYNDGDPSWDEHDAADEDYEDYEDVGDSDRDSDADDTDQFDDEFGEARDE